MIWIGQHGGFIQQKNAHFMHLLGLLHFKNIEKKKIIKMNKTNQNTIEANLYNI